MPDRVRHDTRKPCTLFGIILTSIVSLVHIYVFWRIASVPFVGRSAPRKFVFGTGLFLWAVFLASRIVAHGGTSAWTWVLEFAGMTWMGILFLLFVSLLVADVVSGFGYLMPRLSGKLKGGGLVIGLMLSVIALIQGMRPPVVNDYEVHLRGLPAAMDGTVLVALSDLHVGSLIGETWLAARVRDIGKLNPDMIVLLGDIFEGHGQPVQNALPILRRLSAPLGVWAVAGNHEFYGGLGESISLISQAGFEVLHNRWTEVRPGFIVAGIDDLTADYRAGGGNDFIARALAGHPSGAVVLLSHSPLQTDRAAAAGANVMLSGHTHGGQIWPFGYLVRRAYPFLEGRFQVDGMTLLVTRGAGTWGPRMRLWHPGEILRITLRAE